MKITASVCHDSLNAKFEVPEGIVDWTWVVKELQSEEYKHSLIVPPSEDKIDVKLDTPLQLAKFVSWLSNIIAQNW